MTCKAFYKYFLRKLQTIYSANEADIITGWIFEKFTGLKKSDIIISPDQGFDNTVYEKLNKALEELLRHKPVQQITGEAWFCKIKFKVNEHVLIPRPETEELVELVIKEAQRHKGTKAQRQRGNEIEHPENIQPPTSNIQNILDIGTGSGCIPITLKKHLPDTVITSIDISRNALKVAKENAEVLCANILFMQLDFLDEAEWKNLPKIDIIVSNPPYIPVSEKEKLDKNVIEYEPHEALFVPDHSPLLFYEKIALFGEKNLKENGKIFLETHEDYAKQTAEIFLSKNYTNVEIIKDIFGKERFVSAQKK